jgi:hypothetical protein
MMLLNLILQKRKCCISNRFCKVFDSPVHLNVSHDETRYNFGIKEIIYVGLEPFLHEQNIYEFYQLLDT